VIESFLAGEEASFIVMADGEHVLALAPSQDHKRLRDGDQGPNTGGMGAYSPAPVVTPEVHERALREIILPAIRGMAADGISYTGFLYAGLMIDPQGQVKTLEFNCRLGDPETQPIMARLQSDLVELLEAGIDGRLDQVSAEWNPQVALGVVLAAAGYPDSPRKGDPIHGLPLEGNTVAPGVIAFHAGTQSDQDQVLTSGGRVMCVTALGDSVREARERVYAAIEHLDFAGLQMRRDIGYRAL
jgi:phosphoribosylamine--glycine ligase